MDDKTNVLQKEYKKRFESNCAYRDSVWQILCRDFLSHYVKGDSIVLDLGAGWGEFSRNIKAKKIYAMDLNPYCGDLVPGYVDFIQQDCSARWPFDNETLDVIFTSNFLEHLLSKVAVDATIREAHRCLKKGGSIICIGPNIRYVAGQYWDFWDHYIPITDRSMVEALILGGFLVKESIPRFLPFTMSDGKNPPLIFVKAYLRMRFLWPLLGKQFFVQAIKT
jgi:SAM-dependent methyltransferase